MIMVYITGDVIQPDCTCKPGTQWVHTIEADETFSSRPRAFDRIPDLLRDYEFREGQCSSFTIQVVK
jgi:hypothetical protein